MKQATNKKSASRLIKWIRTNNERAFKPTFDVMCPHCDEKMFLRNSELTYVKKNYYGYTQLEPAVFIQYKCIPCAFVMKFQVGHPYMDSDYWNEVFKWRDNHPLWNPPISEWSDDVKIQERLKALGYIGGSIDYKDETELEEK